MPLYDYLCEICHKQEERFLPMNHDIPLCCGQPMRRIYSIGYIIQKWHPPLWINRMDDIHKAQEQRGERLRYVSPQEIGANYI